MQNARHARARVVRQWHLSSGHSSRHPAYCGGMQRARRIRHAGCLLFFSLVSIETRRRINHDAPGGGCGKN